MDKTYAPHSIEQRWYQYWESKGYFIARDGVYAASQSGTGAAIALSLGAIAGFCDARLRDEILYLNQVLYGKETDQWNGKKLFQAFTENKARAKLAAIGDKSLEPLYRL